MHFVRAERDVEGCLEGHVLEEVRGTVALVGLVSATRIDENSDGGRLLYVPVIQDMLIGGVRHTAALCSEATSMPLGNVET